MRRPAQAYAEYARSRTHHAPWSALRRIAFVALIQGVAIAMAATQTVAAPVVASLAACWSAALAVQLLAAVILIRSARTRTIPVSGALDLFYLGHAPWSLWLLTCAAAFTWLLPYFTWIVLLTMVVPVALTARIVIAFAQHVLGLSRREALRRTMLHQVGIWLALIGCLAAAVALWPRIAGYLDR